jgi:glycosyltransferase involved in cell wall biosynthesis
MLILDCSRIASLQSGLGRFSLAISQALQEIGLTPLLVAGCDGFSGTISPTPRFLRTRSKVSVLKPLAWMLYARLGFPCRPEQPMLSVMQNVIPRSQNQVVTIHDLRPCFYPDNPIQGFYWKHVLPRSLRRAKAIVTVSQTSKEKIQEVYRIAPEKIHVVSNCFVPDPAVVKSLVVPYPRLLCVGGNWRHKNIHELLEMHALWRDRYEVDIVMAKTAYFSSLQQLVDQYGLDGKVHFHHGVSDERLKEMYRTSAALVYPSLDEGFGIPPLEAMSYDLPVIASNIPVLKELFSEAPLYISPGNFQSWERSFASLEDDEQRTRHVNAGREVARRFTPETMRKQLEAMIRSVWPEVIGNVNGRATGGTA